jgi:RNase P/RNase MRP subunit p30
MTIDLGMKVKNPDDLDSFVAFAEDIGLNTLAVPGDILKKPFQKRDDGILVLSRLDVAAKRLPSVKKTVGRVRRKHALVTIRLTKNVEMANWAAEDNRIDLITLSQSTDSKLRSTTARIAAKAGTALEVQFAPLLQTSGLIRSRILKGYRENVATAIEAGMQVVISSGAEHVLNLRSPRSMQYIGTLLGIDFQDTSRAVLEFPRRIVERNLDKLRPDFLGDGMTVIEEEHK